MKNTKEVFEKQRLLLTGLDKTKELYGLDSLGNMKNMIGKIQIIDRIHSDIKVKVYCEHAGRTYTFSIEDFELPVEEVKAVVFKYDTQYLDI